MSKIKIGLIGCGKQAPKHISGLQKISDVQIVVADINYELATTLANKYDCVVAYETPDDIFNDPDIKAVDICTPTSTHGILIRKAVKSGKDFLCEKPLCDSLREAEELAQITKQAGRIGMIGYIYRFNPVFEEGKSIFKKVQIKGASDVLGKPVFSYLRLGGRGSHKVWKHKKETGGGAINEMLVHMLDLAIWYFGPVKDLEVLACETLLSQREIEGSIHEVDAEDLIIVRLNMTSGSTVICQADLVTPAFTQFMEIQCEKGTYMGSIQQDMPSFVFCKEENQIYSAGKNIINCDQVNLFEKQMTTFVEAVRNNKPLDRCTLEENVYLMQALELIKEKVGE